MNKEEKFNQWIRDAKLESQSETAPNHLWDNILKRLEDRHPNKIHGIISKISSNISIALTSRKTPVFAAAIIAFVIIINIISPSQLISVEKAKILATEVDDRIFIEHTKYEQKINRLYENVSNIDLLSSSEQTIVNFEKLISIDMVISKCKSALELNPYSTKVNMSLISAFQEKIETINLLINLKTRIS